MRIPQIISSKLLSISIRFKFLLIILLSNILIVGALSMVFSIVTNRHRNMLYSETASLLSYTNHELETQLDTMKDISKKIVSSDEVQSKMNILRSSKSFMERNQAHQDLNVYLQQVQYECPDKIVLFLGLETPITSIYTNLASSRKVPREIRSVILQQALMQNGIPRFVIDYNDHYGLILTRSIRQAQDLSLINLGVVFIGIDLRHLMGQTMGNLQSSNDQAMILSSKGSIFYHSDSLEKDAASAIQESMNGEYKLIPYNGKTYFAIQGKLDNYDWDYIYLLDYTNTQNLLKKTYFFVLLCMFFFTSLVIVFSHRIIRSVLKHMDNLMNKIVCFRKQRPIEPLFPYDYSIRKDELGALHTQFDAMTLRINTLIKENYKKEILKNQAELQALRAQINPHFLYNTLNTINWRAKAIGADHISLMVESLGKILRMSISNIELPFTLGDSVELQQAYLTIQKIRYDKRLEYEIHIPQSLYPTPFPRLILQPLVENAVRYGVEENLGPTQILITATQNGSDLCITVRNSGSEFPEDLLQKLQDKTITPHGFGIGLLNIHKRLRYTYGEAYGLRLENKDEMATVYVTVPMSPKGEKVNAETDHR